MKRIFGERKVAIAVMAVLTMILQITGPAISNVYANDIAGVIESSLGHIHTNDIELDENCEREIKGKINFKLPTLEKRLT